MNISFRNSKVRQGYGNQKDRIRIISVLEGLAPPCESWGSVSVPTQRVMAESVVVAHPPSNC